MINELSGNPLFFQRYFPPEPSMISHARHSIPISCRWDRSAVDDVFGTRDGRS